MKKNILKKSKKVLFAIAATVVIGISPLKAQWWEENIYIIANEAISPNRLEIDVAPTEVIEEANCEPIVFKTNRHGFYFNKPIFAPKIVGAALELNLTSPSYCPSSPLANIELKVNDLPKLIVRGSDGRVGINTTDPHGQLDVNGAFIIHFNATQTWHAASLINHTATTDWSSASLIKVDRDYSRAISVVNTDGTEEEVFTIWGNGIVNAKKNICTRS